MTTPERIKRWRNNNREHSNEIAKKSRRKRKAKKPEEYKSAVSLANKKYRKGNKEKCDANVKNWRKNNREKARALSSKQTAKRRRNFGYITINKKFLGSVGHHIDKIYVMYIPEEMHRLNPHRQDNRESMIHINLLAWEWFLQNSRVITEE